MFFLYLYYQAFCTRKSIVFANFIGFMHKNMYLMFFDTQFSSKRTSIVTGDVFEKGYKVDF